MLRGEERAEVVYAAGYGAGTHVRGDDFVEFLGEDILGAVTPDSTLEIVLDPYGETFEISVLVPRGR